jgi:hypothetical protein
MKRLAQPDEMREQDTFLDDIFKAVSEHNAANADDTTLQFRELLNVDESFKVSRDHLEQRLAGIDDIIKS